jgi:sugar phosphate isomerase/epimerase
VAHAGADCLELLSACDGRLGLLHVRDVRQGVWCQAIGEGELDLAEIGRQLQKSEYEGWVAVELWFDRATLVTRSIVQNARVSRERLYQWVY